MPRNIQTFLPDGTLEGVRIIELSESNVKAFVIPRIKLNDIKDRIEINQPALYFLIGSEDGELYIGESENFLKRVRDHDQLKGFWDVAIAVVSNTNVLEKSDVKYLESLAVERAKSSAAMQVLNKTIPARNNVHEFKVHTLQKFLDDAAIVAQLVGHSIFATRQDESTQHWYCKNKLTDAVGEFRGDQFILLTGSIIDESYSDSFQKNYPQRIEWRKEVLAKHDVSQPGTVKLIENVAFQSANQAGWFCVGTSNNAWTTWKNKVGQTMDEVMRKGARH